MHKNSGIGNVKASKSCEMLHFMQIRGKNPEQQPNSVSQASQAKVVTDKKTVDSAGDLLYLYT